MHAFDSPLWWRVASCARGAQEFDFNHLNNVLISRDCRKARLIDIDGASQGSIQFPSRYIDGRDTVAPAAASGGGEHEHNASEELHRPALRIDLATLLPLIVQQLMFGKGRGNQFVTEQISLVRRAPSEDAAKGIIAATLRENFFGILRADAPSGPRGTAASGDGTSHAARHLAKVVEWFYALLMKRPPWTTWTKDIYDAMRMIDHLPIGALG